MNAVKYPGIYHIGCMKTGTTTVQKVFAEDNRINLIKYSRFFNTNKWYTDTYNYYKEGLINIESDENIVSQYDGMYGLADSLGRIREVSPDAHIVLTIREQRSLLLSGYKHRIGSTKDRYTFLEFLNSGAGVSYLSMCDYNKLLDVTRKYFDMENIHIFLFEKLKSDFVGFFKDIYSEVLGIPIPNDLKLTVENRGRNDQSVVNNLMLNNLFISRKDANTYNFEKKIHHYFIRSLNMLNVNKDKKISWGKSELEQRLEEKFRESNFNFSKNTGIRLKENGYLTQ